VALFRRPKCRKAKGNWSGSFGMEMVLMVLLEWEEKGWSFGSTRNRTAAEVRLPARRSGLCVRGRRKKSGPGRCSEMQRCWWSTKLERRSGGGG
jgi:hypothetical protein